MTLPAGGPSSARTTVTLHHDPTFTLVSRANVLVATWRDAPTVPQLRIVDTHSSRIRRAFAGEYAFANVIVSGDPEGLSKEVRDEANQLAQRQPALCAAQVVLVDGLAGTVVRTIMRVMGMIAQNAVPWRVFGSELEAARWMTAHLDGRAGEPWTAAELTRLFHELGRLPRG